MNIVTMITFRPWTHLWCSFPSQPRDSVRKMKQMNRSIVYATFGMLAVTLAIAPLASYAAPAQPNIILIMPDDTIAPEQMERLHAMSKWLKINGAAIYGTRYWKESAQKSEHLAFTTKGKNLYAIKLAEPSSSFTITGTAGWKTNQVKSVRLLGSDSAITWEMTPQGLRITPPEDLGGSLYAWSFEIVADKEQHHPNVIVADADKALKGTKKVDLEGNK